MDTRIALSGQVPDVVGAYQNALANRQALEMGQMKNALAAQEMADMQQARDFAASPEGVKQKQQQKALEVETAKRKFMQDNLASVIDQPSLDDFNMKVESIFGEQVPPQFRQFGPHILKIQENMGIIKKEKDISPFTFINAGGGGIGIGNKKTGEINFMGGSQAPGYTARDGNSVTAAPPYQGLENDPINFITDPKERNKAIAKRLSETEKELNAIDESSYQLGETAHMGRQFMSALESQEKDITGSYGAALTPSMIGKFDQEISTMDAITAKLTPAQRVAGSGTTSDKDMAFFEKATLGRGKNKETNRSISDAMIYVAKRAQDKSDFFRDYASQNAGDLSGAKRIWNDYINSESVSNDGVTFNPSAKDFKTWFSQRYSGGQNRSSTTPARKKFNPATGRLE